MAGRGRMAGLAVIALLVQIVAAPASSAEPQLQVDWTQFRFDQAHTGVQPFEHTINPDNVIFLSKAWEDQLGDIVDGSSPAVVDGTIYIGSSDGTLWAYRDAPCGTTPCTHERWHSTYLAQILDSPVVANGFVYIGSQTSFTSNDGKLDVFDADGCGQLECPPLWQGLAGNQSILDSSPTVAGDLVYIGGYDGNLYAFDAAGCGQALCDPLWFGRTGGHIESSPTVVDGVAYIGSDDGQLYAFDADGCGQTRCRPLWTGRIGEPVFSSSPAVIGGTVYVGSAHGLVAFPAAGCGASRCDAQWKGVYAHEFFGGSPAIANGRVYIGVEDGVAVFDAAGCGRAKCGPEWVNFGTGPQAAVLSSPTVANGVVYAGRNTGRVLAWDADGCGAFFCDELWYGLTNDPIVSSSPTVANGRLYIGSSDQNYLQTPGRVYVFDLTI